MRGRWIGWALALAAPASGASAAPGAASVAEHQAACAGRDGWSDPAPPIRVAPGVYDVGTCGIVVLLVVGDRGAVLIDGATAAAAPSIVANVERLGLRPTDVKFILSSHEHADHAGGFAALLRRTGATMVATAAARRALETGVPDATDPQRDGDRPAFAGVRVGRIVRDGEVLALGDLRLTAHATPGHAPGGTSWSWRSCEGVRCHRIVFADSVSAVSTDAYRFADHPRYVATFRRSLARIAALPCDLLVTPHPAASRLYDRLAGRLPLTSPTACRDYAATGAAQLDARIAREKERHSHAR